MSSCAAAMLRLIVLSLAVLSCHALTDQEIALFYNDGCANGTVSVVRVSIRKTGKFMCSTMGRLQSGFNLIAHFTLQLEDEIVLSTNGVPDHKWQLVSFQFLFRISNPKMINRWQPNLGGSAKSIAGELFHCRES